MYETADIRKGLRIELDSEPYAVIEFQFVKPGKGNAFTRTRIRNLINGSVLDRTFKTGEKLKPADTQDRTMQFLYRDEGDGGFHFMDNSSYEQVALDADLVGGKSCKRDLDAIMLVIILRDIVSWVIRFLALGYAVELVEQGVEADELACHWRGKEGHLISPFQSETVAASRYGKAAFT